MTVSLWLKAYSVVFVLFGLGFLIAPSALGSSYAGGVNATTELALRYLGTAYLAIALVSWFAGATSSPAPQGDSSLQRWVVRAFAVYSAVSLVVDVIGLSGGVLTSTGYTSVAIDVVFLAAFGYFGFARSERH